MYVIIIIMCGAVLRRQSTLQDTDGNTAAMFTLIALKCN